jgi:hypothetical protein
MSAPTTVQSSSLDSRSRTQGPTPVFEICGFCYGRTADPKGGGPRYPNTFALTRVAYTLSCMYAPHGHGQNLCHRVRSVAGSGFCSTGTPACVLCMECIRLGHRQECLCYISRLVHEGFFHRFRVFVHHRQVGAHGAFRTLAPLLPFLARATLLTCQRVIYKLQ